MFSKCGVWPSPATATSLQRTAFRSLCDFAVWMSLRPGTGALRKYCLAILKTSFKELELCLMREKRSPLLNKCIRTDCLHVPRTTHHRVEYASHKITQSAVEKILSGGRGYRLGRANFRRHAPLKLSFHGLKTDHRDRSPERCIQRMDLPWTHVHVHQA